MNWELYMYVPYTIQGFNFFSFYNNRICDLQVCQMEKDELSQAHVPDRIIKIYFYPIVHKGLSHPTKQLLLCSKIP